MSEALKSVWNREGTANTVVRLSEGVSNRN